MKDKQEEIIKMLEKANQKLLAAKELFNDDFYDDAVSRAYYSAFIAVSALLLSKNLTFSKHSQVLGAFNKEFVKTGIFNEEITKKLYELFDNRQIGDYSYQIKIEKEKAKKNLDDTENILNQISNYLKS